MTESELWMAAVDTNDLVAEVTQIPVNPGAAMRLLWMIEDPGTTVGDLGKLIETDPALSAQVIRHANAAFYGLSGTVASASRAVSVLGLSTVRALATAAAFDLFADRGRAVPDAFWPHCFATAASAAVLARHVGVDSREAFSAGLLHDIGTALVYRRAPRRYEDVLERLAKNSALRCVDLEIEEFGFSHAQVGAAALGVMKFPSDLVDAVARHHDEPSSASGAMARLVIAAVALTFAVEHPELGKAGAAVRPTLEALGLPADLAEALVEEARCEGEKLADALTARG